MASITRAVRGAIQLEHDRHDLMREAIIRLIDTIMSRNAIKEDDIISIQFSQTDDLISANPATCLRSNGFSNTSLFCTAEPRYTYGFMPRVIRVLLTYRSQHSKSPIPIYLDGAVKLRMDILTPTSE